MRTLCVPPPPLPVPPPYALVFSARPVAAGAKKATLRSDARPDYDGGDGDGDGRFGVQDDYDFM